MEIHSSLAVLGAHDKPTSPRPVPEARSARETAGQATQSDSFVRIAPGEDTLHKAQQFHAHASYDQPQGKAFHAVNAYLQHDREQQRDTIRDMMGVDIYA